jgi:FkbM family methyltransferase
MSVLTSFYSQNFEDVLLSRVLSDLETATYIDVGCQHETVDSVTKHFSNKGWSGINLDPVEEHIREFACRPNDTSLPVAAGATPSLQQFTVIAQSGLSSFHPFYVATANELGLTDVQSRLVEVRTLTSILDEYLGEKKPIAFLKIDVEGHEYEVLQGMDLERYRPIIILVETTIPCTTELSESYPAIRGHLALHDYHEVYFDGVNSWWLSGEELDGRKSRFSYPVGLFDGYGPSQIRQQLIAYSAELEQLRSACMSLRVSPLRRVLRKIRQRLGPRNTRSVE